MMRMLLPMVLAAGLTAQNNQVRPMDIYIAHLKDEALRQATAMVSASESLLLLFRKRAEQEIDAAHFETLTEQRLKLIRTSARQLAENPVIERMDRAKKGSEKGLAKENDPDVEPADPGVPPALNRLVNRTQALRRQLHQLEQGGPGRTDSGERRPRRSTVTVEELQQPRIRDLCKEIRMDSETIARSLKSGNGM